VISYKEGPWHCMRMYWSDDGRQPLVRTFLGKGPNSPKKDEDTVATVADDSITH
jgi:hypothetical protein